MENKNIIIALVLMMVVWLGFTLFFPPQKPLETSGKVEKSLGDTPAERSLPEKRTLPPTEDSQLSTTSSENVEDIEITIENSFYEAVFSNTGARLKSLVLKNFSATSDPGSPKVSLVEAEEDQLATLRTTGSGDFLLPPDALYSVDAPEKSISLSDGETRNLIFQHRTPSGIVVEKIYTFYGDQYPFDLEIRVINQSSDTRKGSLEVSLVHPWNDEMAGKMYEHVGPTTFAGEEIHTVDVKDLDEAPENYSNQVVWTAFETKYFIGAVAPLEGASEKVQVRSAEASVENVMETPFLTLAPGESVDLKYFLYFGPRDLDILKSVNYQLSEAIDFGFFSPIARPLLHVLKFFYKFVGNYGVSIILLTVIIKLLFWPLTHKSYASMKNMQKLQPEMQKIREKFKNNREKMNKEIMELYKKHRVNPLGGCLPMVIQIPVFFALYKVLLGSIELRHAPFFLWITDLSAKDPYYVTPLIMGATMFLQQKMSPTTMDPAQAKIFMLMPVIFTVMFLNFPAGLVLYWLVNNLLTIAQQAYINRKH